MRRYRTNGGQGLSTHGASVNLTPATPYWESKIRDVRF